MPIQRNQYASRAQSECPKLPQQRCNWLQIEASIAELAQEGLEARLTAAQAERDAAQGASQEAAGAVEAAERELAGAQAGDGRDESNRSLQERLGGAKNAQVGCWCIAC